MRKVLLLGYEVYLDGWDNTIPTKGIHSFSFSLLFVSLLLAIALTLLPSSPLSLFIHPSSSRGILNHIKPR